MVIKPQESTTAPATKRESHKAKPAALVTVGKTEATMDEATPELVRKTKIRSSKTGSDATCGPRKVQVAAHDGAAEITAAEAATKLGAKTNTNFRSEGLRKGTAARCDPIDEVQPAVKYGEAATAGDEDVAAEAMTQALPSLPPSPPAVRHSRRIMWPVLRCARCAHRPSSTPATTPPCLCLWRLFSTGARTLFAT